MAKAQRRFQYEPRSREDVKERANMRGGGFDSIIKSNIKRYKMRDGKNVVRVMPPTWEKPRHYGFDIWINYGIGVDNQSYLSLSKMKSEADPIEEARKEANRSGDDETSKALAPRQRVLMWVIDRLDEEEGPQLFDAPFTVDKALANLSLDEDTKEVTLIDDPENGCDFRFYKEGAGLKTDYDASKMKLLKPSVLCEDEGQQDEWLDFIEANPVPTCLQYYGYDHIASMLNGKSSKKDAGDEDEERPPARRGGVARRTAREAAAEDEDGDEGAGVKRTVSRRTSRAPVEEDQEPEEKPAVRRSRARAEPEPVEDEEGGEPEPTPSRRGRAEPGEGEAESISQRLRRRRASAPSAEDDDD